VNAGRASRGCQGLRALPAPALRPMAPPPDGPAALAGARLAADGGGPRRTVAGGNPRHEHAVRGFEGTFRPAPEFVRAWGAPHKEAEH